VLYKLLKLVVHVHMTVYHCICIGERYEDFGYAHNVRGERFKVKRLCGSVTSRVAHRLLSLAAPPSRPVKQIVGINCVTISQHKTYNFFFRLSTFIRFVWIERG
jgi:hypothetical protein